MFGARKGNGIYQWSKFRSVQNFWPWEQSKFASDFCFARPNTQATDRACRQKCHSNHSNRIHRRDLITAPASPGSLRPSEPHFLILDDKLLNTSEMWLQNAGGHSTEWLHCRPWNPSPALLVLTLHIPSIYPRYTLHVPSMYPPYTLHIPSVYLSYTLHIPSRYPPDTLHIPSIYPACHNSNIVDLFKTFWNSLGVCHSETSWAHPLTHRKNKEPTFFAGHFTVFRACLNRERVVQHGCGQRNSKSKHNYLLDSPGESTSNSICLCSCKQRYWNTAFSGM